MAEDYVLITGATGFIGSHVTQRLIEENSHRIVAFVRKGKGQKNVEKLEARGVVLAEGNFYDRGTVKSVFERYPIQNVIHLAALRGAGAGTSEDYHKVNVLGVEVLLDESLKHGVRRFVFCSSVGVFGTIPSQLPAGLKTPLNGDNDYHRSKIQAEAKVGQYMAIGLDAAIIRPTIAYGKGDRGFPAKLVELVKKRRLILPGEDIHIHMVSVKKLAELFAAVAARSPLNQRIFIGVDRECISLKALADLIHAHYFGMPYPHSLQAPDFIYSCSTRLAEILGSEKWAARLKLLSRSWFYESSDLRLELGFEAGDTWTEFKDYLEQVSHLDL